MDNNQTSDNKLAIYALPDSIQEFNLITSNAPAEFGNFQGGIVNASIKSGTNQFHGDAWEFFRNNVLNANQWENKFDGPGNFLPRAALRWNMFGGTRRRPGLERQAVLFRRLSRAAFRSSDDVELHDSVHRRRAQRGLRPQISTQLKNPITGVPYTGNQIPMTQINPVAAALFASKYYPTPINSNPINNAVNLTNGGYRHGPGGCQNRLECLGERTASAPVIRRRTKTTRPPTPS